MRESILKFLKFHSVRRFGLWFTGIGIYYWVSWVYDYIFITFILWKYGNITGGIIAMFVSMIFDLGTLKFYDWLKSDWLALETIKDMENEKTRFAQILKWLHNKGSVFTVIVLSFLVTPFVITAYMRKGAGQYNGMSNRDAVIFLSSSLLSNFYWIVVVGSGISIIQYVYNFFIIL